MEESTGRELHMQQESQVSTSETTNTDAVFIGWQELRSGELVPLYTVTAKQHPLYHSTVSEQTLRKQHLEIPRTPPPERP